jgi:glutathione S-transferase
VFPGAFLPWFCHWFVSQGWLDVNGIQYRSTEVNPLTKTQLKKHPGVAGGYSQVPIALVPFADASTAALVSGSDSASAAGVTQVNDSQGIMKALTKTIPSLSAPFPIDGADKELEGELQWAYEQLVGLLPANIYSTLPEAFEVFSYAQHEKTYSAVERATLRYFAPLMMYVIGGRIAQRRTGGRHNARAVLHEELAGWATRVASTHGDFRFGNEPTAADAVVFGMLRAMTGMQTLRDVLAKNSALDAWFVAMEASAPSCELERS